MVVGRDRAEVWVRPLVVGHIGAVDLELQLVGGGEDGHVIARLTSDQALDRVVEVQLLHLLTRRESLLHLVDDDLLRLAGEELALLGVDVRKVGVALPLVRVRAGTPRDAEFDVVVGEGHEWEGVLPRFTEEESEGVETRGGAAFVETTEAGLGEVLGQDLRGDERGEEGVLGVDDLTTDEQFNLVDDRGPVGDGRVGLGAIGLHRLEVHVRQEVPLALDAHRGHAIGADVALDHLTFDRL